MVSFMVTMLDNGHNKCYNICISKDFFGGEAMTEQEAEVMDSRGYSVVKANSIIQKSRYKLSIAEQKTIAYICSMIKPIEEGEQFQLEYTFNIRKYCRICGLNYGSGKNYSDIKAILQNLSDKSMWLKQGDEEILVRWLAKVRTNKQKGTVNIKVDEDLVPYLFGLKQQFTQYQLLDILAMKSAYSIRIYELLKSYAGLKKKVFELEDLKKKLMVEDISSYNRFPDFRRKVLDVAINEINNLTALNVSYEPISKGRKVIKIEFHMNMKKASEYTIAMATAENMLETKI